MGTRRFFPTAAVVSAIALIAIGLFLAIGGSFGTTAGSPIAGTWIQTLVIAVGTVMATVGAAIIIVALLKRPRERRRR